MSRDRVLEFKEGPSATGPDIVAVARRKIGDLPSSVLHLSVSHSPESVLIQYTGRTSGINFPFERKIKEVMKPLGYEFVSERYG